MAQPKKQERNEQLVNLRNKDPKKYSFSVLAGIFKIKKETAHEIYHREMKLKRNAR